MNPKLSKFIEDNPQMTILGFAWACYWRLMITVYGIALALVIVAAVLGGLN